MIARTIAVSLVTAAAVVGVGCGRAVPPPATLDTAHDACAYCRMIVSDRHFSAQIVAPLEEPRFFDDLGCLANYLKASGPLPTRAAVYVADHSTLVWIPGSHVIAHASGATRAADPAARTGTPIDRQDVFPAGFPGANR